MASIQELKRQINMEDLAEKLGLTRGKGGKGLWHSPTHDDSTASLSIFQKNGDWGFKDWSNEGGDSAKGSIIDLVVYAGKASDTSDAIKYLHELYSIQFDKPETPQERQEKTLLDHIAENCRKETDPLVEYLKGRGIAEKVIQAALKAGSIGWNTWTSTKVQQGEAGHGGPAAAFIVRARTGAIAAVDFRYADADMNGGRKTSCQGEKLGHIWTSDMRRLQAARTVYIVESPINALSVETALPNDRYTAVLALRGVANINAMDWSWLRGKLVRICLDHADKVNPQTNFRPGLKAAWDLHERLTVLDVPALLVDQGEWEEATDVNDVLQAHGAEKTGQMLKYIEPWLIPGLPGKEEGLAKYGRRRVHLPGQDFHAYWKFRVRDDFTQVITKFEVPTEEEEDKRPKLDFGDLCGFRVASLSRVTIQSATATMTGDPDAMPRVQFSVSVQTARHGTELLRRVYDDQDLYNLTKWEKFGAIYSPANFKRMVNVLERTSGIGARHAVNFVGLAWREGRLAVNEGPDCYFTEPDKQCPYSGLLFPSGTRHDARLVVEAFGATMKDNAATLLLAWGLGGHLKPFLGFWPHMQMQANKGAGKSTLIKKYERAIAFTMLSGQSLQTEFRLVTSVSHTTHPIGWEELSARRQDIIDKAVGLLQETYQYTVTRRGGDMTEYLLSAPVLLAGEDVPVRSLIGKLVRIELSGKKGKPIPENLPRFPVKEWLQFLASLDKGRVQAKFEESRAFCFEGSRASGEDDGAMRMTTNYAALLTAWALLAEFAGLPEDWNGVPASLLAEMNHHIGESSSDREPWVWITEILLSEISAGEFRHPYTWDTEKDEDGRTHEVLLTRTSYVMDHISGKPALREKWNGLPVKSDRVYRKQLASAGVIVRDPVERTIGMRRVSNMVALSLEHMRRFGLHATPSNDMTATRKD
ncbi:hypothetical protein IGB42_02608 [Andreprevotia sp. IGB-42]|uniref:toprim domain-containing protein n=1 Tax=Andreprevotia sp. IGB-42 TaxID=2497473 RepID=UPI001358DD62|nr:toprim domain-containing protein [Andreprevotia sp. IGB-42]KAF0812765.1 hypothetical protein IGB42_02608 [Andreprevotia sp. IGB-42]